MLQIKLSKGGSLDGGGGGANLCGTEKVTVACPDHLILADLPVAKSVGSGSSGSLVKMVGRRSRRQLGERIHFCVRCDFPIAVYGRLSPCEHAFCLDCARSDSICYLCDERIQKIQTIKMLEGIFICAAPHCLKSFTKSPDFRSHVVSHHSDLLHPPSDNPNHPPDAAEQQQSFNKPPAAPDQPPHPLLPPLLRPVLRPPFFPFHQPDYRPWSQKPPPLGESSGKPEALLPPRPPPGFPFSAFPLQDAGQGSDQGSVLGFPPGLNGATFGPDPGAGGGGLARPPWSVAPFSFMESVRGVGGPAADGRDGKGILAPPHHLFPPPPPFCPRP